MLHSSLYPDSVSSCLLFFSPPDLIWIFHHRGIANLLNAQEVGMKVFEDYANSWDWILL